MRTNINKPIETDMGTLIQKMRSEDKRNIMISRNFQILMWIMAPLYIILFNFVFDDINIYSRLAGFSFGLAFFIFALIFRRFHKIYSSVDYGLPTIEMLSKAAKRYKMQLNKIVLSLIPACLVDLGAVFVSMHEEEENFLFDHLITYQIIYFSMLAVAISIGYMIWRHKQKPLRDAALKLLKEFQE